VLLRSLSSFKVFIVLLLAGFTFPLNLVKVRYGIHKDKVRVVFDLTKRAKYRVFVLKKPYRIVVDLMGKDVRVKRVRLPKSFSYKLGKHPWGRRVVIKPRKHYSVKAFTLRNPDRLVLDLFKEKRIRVKPRKFVVVIDPGHGGKDPGAIGWRGLKEKWVNFQIARYLAYYLKKDGRFKVIMTRKGDYFVPLTERAKIAIKSRANLFISIHSDAAPKRKPYARGTQIFALSYRGAKQKERQLVNDLSYASLLINDGNPRNRKLRVIISDLAFRVTLEESADFAKILARELRRTLRREVRFKGIRRANFAVLKTPGIPSVLIETGFITNPYESRKLASRRFQKKFAYAVYRAILRYFNLRERRS